ncbi:MAG: FAD-dependent oxidoreductase [Proteobacteria bacterium]|nr:FAD-dependent oxidoreductase [Pseudomonadota bacterium]
MTQAAFHRLGPAADSEISVDGRRVPARLGETVAAAILADGPGKILCAVGNCYQCVATIDGVANRRTCRTKVRAGMVVAHGPAEFHARPAVPRTPMPSSDVVVIGAGPAGAACALALDAEGIATTLLDDNADAGGQVWRRTSGADSGSGAWLRSRVAKARHIDHRPGVEVLDLRDGREVWALDAAGHGHVLRPKAIVIASGAMERNVALPGWNLPGVLNLGGLQALAKSQLLVPRAPVLLAGSGPLLHLVADDLRAAGVRIAAIVDAAAFPSAGVISALAGAPGLAARAFGFAWRRRRAGIPMLYGHRILRIDADGGNLRVSVAPVGAQAPVRHFDVGVVGLGHGLRPNIELGQVAGATVGHDAALGGWCVEVDGGCETSIDGLYAIGEACGVRGAEAALCDATIAAAAVAERLEREISPELRAAVRPARERRAKFERAARALGAWAVVPEGRADASTVICLCEGITRRQLDAARALDLSSPAAIKMATRIGMGLCQGRVCGPIAASASGADAGPPRARFPLRPCPADAFPPES